MGRSRRSLSALVVLGFLAGSLVLTGPPATASPRVCTWGGTAVAPTGTFGLNPGLSNTHPAAAPLAFWAEAPVEGPGCAGTLRIDGAALPGSLCRLFMLSGSASGQDDIAWFFDIGGAVSKSAFYGPDGSLVGSYTASVIDDRFVDTVNRCNTAEGVTGGRFYATIEIVH